MSNLLYYKKISFLEFVKFKKNLTQLIKSNLKNSFPKKKFFKKFLQIKKKKYHNSPIYIAYTICSKKKINIVGFMEVNHDKFTGVATIIWLVVEKNYQNKKIGSTLFKFFLKRKIKNIHKVRVFSFNKKKLICFYKNLGFKIEGKHINHWWKKTFISYGYKINNL